MDFCQENAKLLTGLGAVASLFFASMGSAIASAAAGKYALNASRAGWFFDFAPIVISGVLAIYGIIISVILVPHLETQNANGCGDLSAGLAVGLACLASGIGIKTFLNENYASQGSIAPEGVEDRPLIGTGITRRVVTEPTWRFMMVMVFLEAIGLYGLIVALFLSH